MRRWRGQNGRRGLECSSRSRPPGRPFPHDLPNVIMAPHVAGSRERLSTRRSEQTRAQYLSELDGEPIRPERLIWTCSELRKPGFGTAYPKGGFWPMALIADSHDGRSVFRHSSTLAAQGLPLRTTVRRRFGELATCSFRGTRIMGRTPRAKDKSYAYFAQTMAYFAATAYCGRTRAPSRFRIIFSGCACFFGGLMLDRPTDRP